MIHRFTSLRTQPRTRARRIYDVQTEQPGRPSVEEQRRKYEALGVFGQNPGAARAAVRLHRLTPEEVSFIRQLRGSGGWTLTAIAARFGCHPTTVGEACAGIALDLRAGRKRGVVRDGKEPRHAG